MALRAPIPAFAKDFGKELGEADDGRLVEEIVGAVDQASVLRHGRPGK